MNTEPLASPSGQSSTLASVESQTVNAVQLGVNLLWWVALWAFVFSAILSSLAVIFLLPTDLQNPGKRILYCIAYFATSFLANLAAAGLIYLLSYHWISKWKDLQMKEMANALVVDTVDRQVQVCVTNCLKEWSTGGMREYESFRKVNWKAVILSVEKTIDICVQGWDGLIKENREEWATFFKNNCQVNLFLPFLPESLENSDTISHIATRLNRSIPEQATEIRNTHHYLQEIRNACGMGRVQHCAVERMIWYCLIRIDDRMAYLSLYEHVHGPVTDAPMFEIPLDRFPLTKLWIRKEIDGLAKLQHKPDAVQGQQAT